MAKKQPKNLHERVRSTSKGASSSNSMKNQITNYKTRLKSIKSIGVDEKAPVDDRNWLEKLLNLDQNQGFFKDFFELIGRPQQTLFTGINKAMTGGNFFEGLWEGFSGNEHTYGKDLLETMGMESEDGKLDMADVLGFTLDVVADPMDLALIPLTGGTNIAANAAVEGTQSAVNTAKAVKAVDKTGDALGAINKASKTLDAVKDAKKFISPNQAIFKGIGKGVKATAKGADNVITKILANSDAKVLKNAQELVNKGITDLPVNELLRQAGKTYSKVDNYNALKKLAKDTVNPSKWVNGFANKVREAVSKSDRATRLAAKKVEILANNTAEFVQKYAAEQGITNADEIQRLADNLSANIFRTIEASQDTAIDGVNFIKNLSTKSDVFTGTDESIDALRKVLDDYKLKYQFTKDGIKINKVNGSFNTLKTNKKFLDDIASLDLQKKVEILPEMQEAINTTQELIENNDDFRKLFKQHEEIYPEIGKIFKEETGVGLDVITNKKGYEPHIETPEYANAKEAARVLKGTKGLPGTNLQKSFSSKKYSIADTANAEQAARVQEGIKRTTEQLKKLKSTTYRKELAEKEARVNALFTKSGITKTKYAEKILKQEDKIAKLKSNIANSKDVVNDISNKLSDDIIKKMYDIKDKTLTKNVASSISDYNKNMRDYNNLLSKLDNPNLTEEAFEEITKKSENIYKQIVKNKVRMDTHITRISNYVDNETLKALQRANNSILKTQKVTKLGAKWETNLGMSTEKINILTQAMDDQMARLNNQIQRAVNDYDALVGMGKKAFDENKLKRIAGLEKQLSIYQEQIGRQKLIVDQFEGLEGFLKKADKWTAATQKYNTAVVEGMLNNPDYIVKASDVTKIPMGFVQIDSNKFTKNLNTIKDVLPDQADAIGQLIKTYQGETVYADKAFANLLNIVGKTSDETAPLVKLLDAMNTTFKKWSTATFGFQMRNFSGATTNMWLSGMPATKMPKYIRKSVELLNNSETLLTKVATEGFDALTDAEKASYKLLEEFHNAGFDRMGSEIRDIAEIKEALSGALTKKNLVNDYLKFHMKLNEDMDKYMRMTLFTYAKENPKYLANLGMNDAIEAVRYALFDPANLTDFEKTYLKKIIPFYTFTKQNLYFQMSNLMKNTPKYSRLVKGFNSIYNNLDEDEFYQYQKDNMQLPLPWTDDEGNRLFLKLNLPLADLFEFTEKPLQKVVSSTAPWIKTPIELVTGVNTFTGQPLYSNAVSGLVEALGGQYPQGIKSATQAAEVILTNMGLSNITTNMLKKAAKVIETIKGDATPMELWAEIARSIFQNTNQEKVANSRLYEEMEAYSNYINQLKQQGIEVPTLNEIKLNKLKNKRALYK